MIDLSKLRAELDSIRSFRLAINRAIGRGKPNRDQWQTLRELAERESKITDLLHPEAIIL